MGNWIQIPDGPQIPQWLSDPSKIEDRVLEIVIDAFVGGLWDGVVTIVGWILQLFQVALIDPVVVAGSSIIDALGPVGDAVIDLAYALSEPLRQAAGSGPLAPIVTAFMTAVVLVVVAYLARAAFETVKLGTWK